MTTILTREEWKVIARRGTSGDQVWDILASWEAELAAMTARLKLSEAVCKAVPMLWPTRIHENKTWTNLFEAFIAWREAKAMNLSDDTKESTK